MGLPDLDTYQRRWFSAEVIALCEVFARLLWMLDKLDPAELFGEFDLPETPEGYEG